MSVPDQHRQQAQGPFRCSVLTISDTRTFETDRGGNTVVHLLESAGHRIEDRQICPDDADQIAATVQRWVASRRCDAVMLTGGTGISPRDHTFETVIALINKPLPGYGELFRWLSYQEIGPAAMLSRAVGGLMGDRIIFTMPGSPAAVRLAMEKLILPELGHLVQQARQGQSK